MLRSESGNAAVYGVILILFALFLLWLFAGISPFDVVGDIGKGLADMSASSGAGPSAGVGSFGQGLSGAYGGGR